MNLGALVASLGVDSSGLWEAEKDMEQFASNVQKDMARIQSKLDKVGKQFQDFGKKASLYVSAPILAAGGYAFKMASDMEESINKVDVAFKSSAANIKDWSKNTLTSFGIAQGTALDMTALFGDMATGMGLATNNAADMSKALVGLAGDLSSFKNIGIDQVQTALAGIFTGETESLKRLGIVMTETNLQEYALAQGIMKKVDAMNQAEKVQLRFNYVLSVTNNAQGDFLRTQGGAANQMRIFSESIKEISSTFGKLMLPTVTDMIKWVNNLMKTIGALDDTTKRWIIGIGIAVAAIGPLAFIIGSVMKAFALLTTVVAGTATAVKVLTAAIATNPWGLLVTALAAAGAGIYYYYTAVDRAVASQAKLNAELTKTEKLQNTLSGVDERAATLKDMDRPGLEAFQTEVTNSMAQIKQLQNTSYEDFLNQHDNYLTATENLSKAGTASEKFQAEKQLLLVQKNLENQLYLERLTADKKLNTLQKYYNEAEALKAKFDKVDVNQKVLEANAQAASSFQGLTTDTNLFGKSLEDNQNKLAVYATQLAALKAAGVTGGQGIKIIADRIIGLQTAISMTKLPNVSAVKSISSNYVPTKTNGGAFDKGLSTARPKIIATTVALGNMASVYQRVAVAQEKLSNQTTMWQKLNNGVGLLTSSLQSLSNIGNSLGGTFGKVFDTFLQGFQIVSDVVNVVRSMVSLTKLLTVAETAKQAVTASGIGVTLAAAAAETVKAEASTASAIAGAASSTAWIPIVGVALAVAGITALMIAMSSAKNKTKVPGMANGGVVPSGYPNDSYPAMLTSGETVIPPDKLGADFGRRAKQEVVFKIGHRELIAVLKDAGILNNSF